MGVFAPIENFSEKPACSVALASSQYGIEGGDVTERDFRTEHFAHGDEEDKTDKRILPKRIVRDLSWRRGV